MGRLNLGNKDIDKIISWLEYAENKITDEYIKNAKDEDEHNRGIEYYEEIRYLLKVLKM